MIKFLERKFNKWRRRRTLALIWRKFAESGHPPDDLDDLNIEAALTLSEWRIEQIQLTANSIYFALLRLAEQQKDTGGRNKLMGKNLKKGNFEEQFYGFERDNCGDSRDSIVFGLYRFNGDLLKKRKSGEIPS